MGRNGVSLNWGGFDKALASAAHNLSNTHPLMETIGGALVSGTMKRFQEEEDPAGKKWRKSRRAEEQDGLTLTDKALLRHSIDYAASSDKVMVGSNLAYARIHQLGGKAGKRHKVEMPARPYLGVSDEDMREIRASAEEFLKDSLRG